jgi:hypothetical protein
MRARVIALAAAAVAYVLMTHWLMTGAPASPWNALMVVGPMLGAASVVAGNGAIALAASLRWPPGLVARRGAASTPAGSLYVSQHVAIHLLLA